MSQVSTNIRTLLGLDSISTFSLVHIITPLVTLKDTTASFDIAIPSLGLFTANNGLLDIEPPRLSSVVDRSAYKISYADPEFSKRSLFESVLTGSKVTVYVGFFNKTTSVLGGALPGDPLLDLDDLVVGYSGVVDTQGYTVDPNNGSVTAVIECSSPMASLGLIKSFYTSQDSLKQVSDIDTAFDQVYTGSRQVSHLWGKA